jgi:hypothetical protein
VANQIGEIQSRRLPEPPPAEAASHRHSRDADEDDSGSESYVKIENDSGNGSLVSQFRRRIDATEPVSPVAHGFRDDDECTDTEGYLKPTFHLFPGDADARLHDTCPTPAASIPAESYVSPAEVRNHAGKGHAASDVSYDRPKCALVSQASTSSESHPLISSG